MSIRFGIGEIDIETSDRNEVYAELDVTCREKLSEALCEKYRRRLRLEPARCVYVGDDRRDVEAGHAAGMRTVAVAWGYLGPGASVHDWRAGHVINVPAELLNCLDLA